MKYSLPTNNGGFICDSLDGSEFNKIAQEIVKLFAGQSEQYCDVKGSFGSHLD